MSGIINTLSPFGKYLKTKLMELNKTQRWLSEQTRIDTTTISNMVRGERDYPDKEEAIKDFLDNYQSSLAR